MNETISNTPVIPWGNVGYITYKRTYARETKNGKTEIVTGKQI